MCLLTFQEIISVCSNERTENNESKVFVLCILSHGEKGAIFGTDGKLVQVETLEELFDGNWCNQLAGRPKVFLIQACQGGTLYFIRTTLVYFTCIWTKYYLLM